MISITLPTYNERDTIETTIRSLLAATPVEMEIIVVDDDSPDGTWQVVQALGLPNVKVIRRRARGLAAAFNRGIIESRGEYIGWMDADMGMPPSLIPVMYRKVAEEGYDVAFGSRYTAGGMDDRDERLRVLSSQMINGLARLVLGGGIRDYDSGFILIRRSVLDAVTFVARGHGEYCFEFLYHAHRKGLRMAEVGYRFQERTAGASKSAPSRFRFFVTGMKYAARIVSARLRPIP